MVVRVFDELFMVIPRNTGFLNFSRCAPENRSGLLVKRWWEENPSLGMEKYCVCRSDLGVIQQGTINYPSRSLGEKIL